MIGIPTDPPDGGPIGEAMPEVSPDRPCLRLIGHAVKPESRLIGLRASAFAISPIFDPVPVCQVDPARGEGKRLVKLVKASAARSRIPDPGPRSRQIGHAFAMIGHDRPCPSW